ncbi:MAG: TRAP transporter small permease [Nitrospinaceae bacterium]|nr:TRAP transporter small permease [Nitrospinaceae bacterium]MBT3433120.1 TRAP transporter small permease [Nitrospinaceae bacterium]MBT3820830.1 TRAP transporter small permease [Nitrospinaceae bacterium]MBT4094291.1 TRAP transporter small permease [Nitrospinaceae bacterium]MBT4431554.1 TRAP transporter small permease [Nitrospinaceae bacterium]
MEGRKYSSIRERWESFDDTLAGWEGIALITLLFVMLITGFIQVVLRNLFHTGILGADLLLRQGLLWLGLLGASLAVRGAGRHIEIDIVSRLISPHWAKPARRLTDLFAALVCALLARASLLFLIGEYDAGSRIAGVFPAWVFQLILPVGFAVMAARFLGASLLGRPDKTDDKSETKS